MLVFTGSPAHVSAPSGRVTRTRIRPVIRDRRWKSDPVAPVSCRLSATGLRLLGILVPAGNWALLTVGLPAYRPDPDGVSAFHAHETRLGLGARSTSGTTVFTRPRSLHGRRLPPPSGRSLSPRHCLPPRSGAITRHQRGFTDVHPIPSLPLTCGPQTEREPLGFPLSFTPSRYRPRTSGREQVSNTDLDYVLGTNRPPTDVLTHHARPHVARPPGSYPDRPHTGKRRRADNRRSTTYTVNLLSAGRTRSPHWNRKTTTGPTTRGRHRQRHQTASTNPLGLALRQGRTTGAKSLPNFPGKARSTNDISSQSDGFAAELPDRRRPRPLGPIVVLSW